ncbi:MAG TPA: hypothetical protein VGB23_02220 [Nitrospirota bacterium]
MAWEWQMLEEERALRALRKVVDITARKLSDPETTDEDAWALIDSTREWVLKVFPDKEQAYDTIYKPRFEKIIVSRKGAYERR